MIVEHNVKADPMIGVEYNKNFTLGELANSQASKNMDKILEKEGVNGNITVHFSGEISHEYNAKLNLSTEEISLETIIGELTHFESKIRDERKIFGFVESDLKAEIDIDEFDTNLSFKGNVKANGHLQYQVSYGKDSKGIFFQPQVYFSGVKGTYMISGIWKCVFF